MNNLGIVISREYFTRVKKTSFIVLTILMPFLMAAVVFVPVLFNMVKDDAKKEVVVIDQTNKYMQLFIDAQTNDSTSEMAYAFLPGTKSLEAYRNDEESSAEAVVCITEDLAKNPSACKIYSKSEVQQELIRTVDDILYDHVRKDKLASYNVPELENIIEDMQSELNVKTIKWTDDGNESESSSAVAVLLGMVSALLIYMFVMSYGAMVMQSVMEEKTNRIVEVIVGSVKPFHLMMGKIIGVMLVGFTQILIWGIMLTAIITGVGILAGGSIDAETMQQTALATNAAAQQAAEIGQENMAAEFMNAFANLPIFEVVLLFVVYFFGGYILYASFYAAIGASVNSQEDSSQFMMPMIIIMIIALYGAMGSMENTDGPLAFWASLFPLTSPIVMMVRIPFGVPLWQEILSVTILYATAFAFVWLGGRIYRVGILMYGKKPTFKDMLKWIKW